MRPEEMARWMTEARRIAAAQPAEPCHSFTLTWGDFPEISPPACGTVAGAALLIANEQPIRALITVNFDGANFTKLVALEGMCI
jgi:hypothetical protein